MRRGQTLKSGKLPRLRTETGPNDLERANCSAVLFKKCVHNLSINWEGINAGHAKAGEREVGGRSGKIG